MNSYVSPEIRRLVAERAGGICEYCLIAEEDSYYRHQTEHIISVKHGGLSEPENLALACVFCNRNKGSDIASININSAELIRFYNPRTDVWSGHFSLGGVVVKALTDVAEATIRIMRINNEDRILEREVLYKAGCYPNEAARLLMKSH